MHAIEAENISKNYNGTKALNSISFDVESHEIFGFIGPDGAGKTTLFRILTTLLLWDEGKIKVLGLDPDKDYKKLRPKLGYMPGRFSLYRDLSVEENLTFFASIFKTTIEENYHLVEDIYKQIEPFKNRRAGDLSGGMKQKLALSCALIHKPELLVLDEPTTGVDAVSRKEFWEMLGRLKEQGITIIVSTPYMDEAVLCDRVALIQKGNILDIDTPENISLQFPKKLLAVNASGKYELIRSLLEFEHTYSAYPFGTSVHYTDKRGKYSAESIKGYLNSKGIEDVEIKEIAPGIEDVFMYLMEKDDAK